MQLQQPCELASDCYWPRPESAPALERQLPVAPEEPGKSGGCTPSTLEDVESSPPTKTQSRFIAMWSDGAQKSKRAVSCMSGTQEYDASPAHSATRIRAAPPGPAMVCGVPG